MMSLPRAGRQARRAGTKAEIECSKHSDCDKFKQCLKDARKAGRKERMKKRWKEAMAKAGVIKAPEIWFTEAAN